MSEPAEVRLKRLRMRSWRRGMREMDLILGAFADSDLSLLSSDALDAFDLLLSQNDQELYEWFSGRCSIPSEHEEIIARIREHRAGR